MATRKDTETQIAQLRKRIAETEATLGDLKEKLARLLSKVNPSDVAAVSGLDLLWKAALPKCRERSSRHQCRVAWHRIPFSLSAWESWSPENQDTKLKLLLEGEGRLFLSGTHMTPGLTGWMAGAIESAWMTMEQIHKRVKQ